MSDFLAIAVAQGKVLHLVDWDRPCWFLANDPEGDRLIPDIDSILTDALLYFCFSEFEMPKDLFAEIRNQRRVVEMKEILNLHDLEDSRRILRSRNKPFVLLAHFGILDESLKSDQERFSTPILTAPINIQQASDYGIG